MENRVRRSKVRLPKLIDLVSALCLAGAAAFLILRYLVAGQLWDARSDILWWNESGNGFWPITFHLESKLVGVACFGVLIWRLVRIRKGHIGWLPVLFAAGTLALFGTRTSPNSRDIRLAAQKGMAVVSSIESYNRDHGGYPPSLASLVPEYLSTVLDTGLASRRRFLYIRSDDPKGKVTRGALFLGSDPYVLVVETVPTGTLIYRPSRDYRGIPGHALEGGWMHTTTD